MKFLIKIEEAVDNLILNFIEKMKHATPHSFYVAVDWIKHSPQLVKKHLKTYQAKVRIFFLKFIGYGQHYTTMLKGHFIAVMIYLRSDDFKQRNKLEMVQSSPVEGDEVYYKSPIFEFRFDKTLDISGIYDNIMIYDKNNNALSVNKRTSTFNKLSNDYGSAQFVMLNNLTVGDSYRAVISGALKDKEGVPLTDGITINFIAFF